MDGQSEVTVKVTFRNIYSLQAKPQEEREEE